MRCRAIDPSTCRFHGSKNEQPSYSRMQEALWSGLSIDEKKSVASWVTYKGFFSKLNNALRQGREEQLGKGTLEQVALLDALTQRHHEKPFFVYRGVSANLEELASLKCGDYYNDPGFMAASLSADVAARHFSGHFLLRIRTSVGAALSYENSGYDEKEILLPRGKRFQVKAVRIVPSYNLRDKNDFTRMDRTRPMTFIELEEVPSAS